VQLRMNGSKIEFILYNRFVSSFTSKKRKHYREI